jgi:ER degradation enhancer, mannosidase alpha-like 2
MTRLHARRTAPLAGLVLAAGLLLAACRSTAPAPPAASGAAVPDTRALAERVKGEFLHAWRGYRRYAWGHDDLRPLSKTGHNWYAQPIYFTPVDALSTMKLMGLDAEADSVRTFLAANLSFDRDVHAQVFEITIRHLGGLLSGYQLTGDRRLLALADDLGRRLLPAFNTPTGMPWRFVNLRTGALRDSISNPAETGTLLVEFGTLAKLTNKPVYYDVAKRALVATYNRRSPLGLVPSRINVLNGEAASTRSHISGGIDSYYEYLLKCALLFGDEDCRRMWREGIHAVNTHLADTTGGQLWYGVADMNTGQIVSTTYGALDAFMPGLLALGGDLDRARRLQASGYRMWRLHGIEPERFNYRTNEVTSPGYPLRPEIVESAYYLYHYTRDPEYLRMGAAMFEDFVRYCRTEAGYATLRSVITKEQADEQQSFLFAETFKYFYLLFSPPETLDFEGVVFNTEAHPLRRTW